MKLRIKQEGGWVYIDHSDHGRKGDGLVSSITTDGNTYFIRAPIGSTPDERFALDCDQAAKIGINLRDPSIEYHLFDDRWDELFRNPGAAP